MRWIARLGIGFYKKCISPLVPSVCRYTPTCSVYTYQAVEKYGFFIGVFKGALRIMRCNPFSKGGFDPVKENIRGKAKWIL